MNQARVLVLGFLAACGGSDLSQEDTALAMAAMTAGVNHAEVAASASASGGSVTATATCTGGGSVSISGDWTDDESFSVDLVFAGCSEQGVTVSGDLHYQATSTTSGLMVSMSMSGELSFSGQIEGDCEVDIDMAVSETAVTISGSMCGHDAAP